MLQMLDYKPGVEVPAGGRLFDFPAGTLPATVRPASTVTLTASINLDIVGLLTVGASGAIYMTVGARRDASWGNSAAATWVTA